jgi:DNA helicase II / ATP-dependent DNA helicase PcrA
MNLSERQIEIVNHKDGALLVTASAGSGKTRVLTERIKRLLEEEEGNFHVLALTFTNKTAKEMKDRLDGVKDIDRRAFIGTIHGFCHEVIEKHGYAIGLNEVPQIFEKNEDKISILIQVFEKKGNEDLQKYYINKTTQEQEKFIYNALSYISSQKKNLKGISRFNELDKDIDNRNIQKMYDEYNNLLRDQNAMDFDEVIISAYRIFAERPSIAKIYRKQYQYISIDEAQDLNFAQYEFLKILCNGEHKNILMVGDSKQSLYHFNGSDKKFMENYFVVDFNAQIKKLDLNYRSSKAVIDVANKINPGSMQGFKTDIIGDFQIQTCLNEEEEAIWITDKIETLLKQRIQESEIAILARNRYLFKEIENELQKRNIKFYFKKNGES